MVSLELTDSAVRILTDTIIYNDTTYLYRIIVLLVTWCKKMKTWHGMIAGTNLLFTALPPSWQLENINPDLLIAYFYIILTDNDRQLFDLDIASWNYY